MVGLCWSAPNEEFTFDGRVVVIQAYRPERVLSSVDCGPPKDVGRAAPFRAQHMPSAAFRPGLRRRTVGCRAVGAAMNDSCSASRAHRRVGWQDRRRRGAEPRYGGTEVTRN